MLKELLILHVKHPKGFKASSDILENFAITASQLFNTRLPIPHEFGGLPFAAFLVPTIIDQLHLSAHASYTELVPGEADSFCAHAAQESGAVILSNDSDLLVYDLGSEGAVVSFNQIEFHEADENPDSCSVLCGQISQPEAIATKLGLHGLQGFAYEIKRNRSISLSDAVRRAKLLNKNDLAFVDFCRSYGMDDEASKSQAMVLTNSLSDQLVLDPRISELILSKSISPSMYLPFLFEDPSKSSAWLSSQSLRQIVYSCYLFHASHLVEGSVVEWSRRGNNINSEIFQFSKEIEGAMIDLVARLKSLKVSIPARFSDIIFWRLYALYEISVWNIEQERNTASRISMAYVLTGVVNDTVSWDEVHLSAQVQAVLYSLRMLHQILKISNSSASKLSLGKNVPSSPNNFTRNVLDLEKTLDGFPSIERLFLSRHELVSLQLLPKDVDELLELLASWIKGESNSFRSSTRAIDDALLLFSFNDHGNENLSLTRKRPKKKLVKHEQPLKIKNIQYTNIYNVLPS